ncbi:hypothetical protein BBG19_0708 [Francisella sp. MA067296]|nr:hypothetical protein BBG19_0708 [Francisella sp. MA067296]
MSYSLYLLLVKSIHSIGFSPVVGLFSVAITAVNSSGSNFFVLGHCF